MGDDPVRTEAEAGMLARLETVLHDAEVTGERDGLQRLHDAAARSTTLGPHVTLLVECALQEMRSRARPAADSVAVWEDLRARADASLPSGDSTALRIRAQRAQHVRRCGRAEDLEDAVRLSQADWMRVDALFGPEDFRTATAREQLAVALYDRGLGDDLLRSQRMLREEVRGRSERFGADHPFTWTAKHGLAQVLVRLAETGSRSDRHIAQAERLSRQVATARAERFGLGDLGALNAHLVHAHALILLGQPASAAQEIRYVLAVACRVRAPLEPGQAERLLATAQAAGANPAALGTARCALRLSAACYPADSRPVRQAQQLVDRLGGLS